MRSCGWNSHYGPPQSITASVEDRYKADADALVKYSDRSTADDEYGKTSESVSTHIVPFNGSSGSVGDITASATPANADDADIGR
jgi:hypothetical protein